MPSKYAQVKHFIFRCTRFGLLAALAPVFLYFFLPDIDDSGCYIAAMIDTHTHAQTHTGKKLVLVGGSNLAFGLDSHSLSKEFSVPVVNLGLHGALGLRFMLQEAKYILRQGDIVVLSPEYVLNVEGRYKLQRLASRLFPPANNFFQRNINEDAAIEIARIKERIAILPDRLSAPDTESTASPAKSPATFCRRAFNRYGDHIAHEHSTGGRFDVRELPELEDWEGIELINRFCVSVEQDGIEVFFAYPPYPTSGLEKSAAQLNEIQNAIENRLRAEVVNRPLDSAFPLDDFFDSVYHLNWTGRRKRTERLAAALRRNIRFMKAVEKPPTR